jgi:hypothetical protein
MTHAADALTRWLGTAEFQRRYADWWRAFDARLATGRPLSEADVATAVEDFAATLDLPSDVARGLFGRELNPDACKKFLERPLQ